MKPSSPPEPLDFSDLREPVMKIIVTRAHLNDGTPFDPKRCPIALAIRDSVADLLNVEVGDRGVWIQLEDGTEFYAQLPRMKWMRLYDKGIITRPESFDLKWKELVANN